MGKQMEIFQRTSPSSVPEQCCFSMQSKSKSLHLQAASETIAKDWMVGINHILTSTGRKVIIQNQKVEGLPASSKGRRFSRHFSIAMRPKSTDASVLRMTMGSFFTRYRQKKSRPNRSVRTRIFVFHSRLVGGELSGYEAVKSSGALFWYEQKGGDGGESPRRSDRNYIPVQTITEVIMGKELDIFKTKCADSAENRCVLSIRGTGVTKRGEVEENFLLHLEAETHETALAWLDGIARLLQSQVGTSSIPERTSHRYTHSSNIDIRCSHAQ